MRFYGGSQAFKVIAPFEHGNQPPLAVLLRELFDDVCQLSKSLRRHFHLAQQVILRGIETHRDQHEVGLEGSRSGPEFLQKRLPVLGITAAC